MSVLRRDNETLRVIICAAVSKGAATGVSFPNLHSTLESFGHVIKDESCRNYLHHVYQDGFIDRYYEQNERRNVYYILTQKGVSLLKKWRSMLG